MVPFLPEMREENPRFGVHTKNGGVIYKLFSSVRWFDRDKFAPIIGFQNYLDIFVCMSTSNELIK